MDIKENRLKLSMNGYLVDKMCINLNSTVCTNYVSFYNIGLLRTLVILIIN